MDTRALTLVVFFLSFSRLSGSTQYHTLILGKLPDPPLLKSEIPWVEPEEAPEAVEPVSRTTITVRLEHVDAFNADMAVESLFYHRLRRDSIRVQTLSDVATAAVNGVRKSFSSSVVSGLPQGSGEYFTRVGVGRPASDTDLVLDTGSDVIWIQCQPCKRCYTQKDPVFNPKTSKTFRHIRCNSTYCRSLENPKCNARRKRCLYEVAYGDGSVSFGELASETFTFGRARVPGVVFGCGHYNQGLFVGAAGLLGLGRGKLSFPSVAGARFNRKFSYCLVDRSSSSKPSSMVFGETPVSLPTVYTPLVVNPKLDTFYYVDLDGISVGGSRVRRITSSLFRINERGSGGVIIDSGTSVTRLTRSAYVALEGAFRADTANLKRAPGFSLFGTCYDLSNRTTVTVPTLVLHFAEADVALPASNYLIPVDSKGTFCFAFASASSGLSIIGNIQQQSFRVSFDLEKSRVGFSSRACL